MVHQTADERHMANLPQGNQKLLVVKSWKIPTAGEFGVSRKSLECDIFPASALTLLIGRQEGHKMSNDRITESACIKSANSYN